MLLMMMHVEPHVNPIEFWDDARLKKVVDAEKDSYKYSYNGILHYGYDNVVAKMNPVCVKNMVVKLVQC